MRLHIRIIPEKCAAKRKLMNMRMITSGKLRAVHGHVKTATVKFIKNS